MPEGQKLTPLTLVDSERSQIALASLRGLPRPERTMYALTGSAALIGGAIVAAIASGTFHPEAIGEVVLKLFGR